MYFRFLYHATLPNMNYADIVYDANIVENIFCLFGLRLQLRRRSFFKRLSWPPLLISTTTKRLISPNQPILATIPIGSSIQENQYFKNCLLEVVHINYLNEFVIRFSTHQLTVFVKLASEDNRIRQILLGQIITFLSPSTLKYLSPLTE